jgi:hypothetical protein
MRFETKKTTTTLERQAAKAVWRLCFPSDDWVKPSHSLLTWDSEKDCYCAMSSLNNIKGEKAVFFSWVGVLPYVQRQGLGGAHVDARIELAQALGKNAIVTYTMAHVTQSARNLEKRGFVSYIPQFAWVGSHVNYWIKEL